MKWCQLNDNNDINGFNDVDVVKFSVYTLEKIDWLGIYRL